MKNDKGRERRRRGFRVGLVLVVSQLALCTVQGVPGVLAQTDPKRIYIAPDDHTDYFWTADEATYRQAFLDMIDYYLDLADATSSDPSEFQSRWNCDGHFWIWEYEQNKSASDFQRLIDRIRDGHISFPLNALVTSTGGAPAEAVLRGMYYPGQIERRYDLRVPIAISMENQTLPYGLGALWAGSGAKYSWKGICDCDTLMSDAWDREHDIYWMEGPDGSRVLMKWNSMLVDNDTMGGYAEARYPGTVVDYVDTDSAFFARYPYPVIGAFGKGWDDLQTLTDEFVTTAISKTNTTRTVIVSNEQDFFEDFEASYGASLPSLSSSFGNEWDLYCAALAEVSARVKRSVEKLRSAEAMATLVSLQDPGFMIGREADRDLAWMDLGLFWEHNFGMVFPQTGSTGVQKRIVWQNRLAGEIETYVDTLQSDAVDALAGMLQKIGTNLRFYAFNALSWTRTDTADLPYADTDPFHVIDLSTGLEAPSQIVTVDGERRLRVLAEDVPPVGYKVFEVRSGPGSGYSDAASVGGSVIENAFYQITVSDRGAITSLIDKTRGDREFVAEINGRFFNDLGSATGTLEVENAGPVSVTVLATSASPVAHTTRVTLTRDSPRIALRNDINENFDATYTWGFGFDVDTPDVWHEELGAVIRAKLLAQGGHYSPRNARYDWLTLNHFADVSNGAGTVGLTLSNADCYFMKLGNSSVGSLDSTTPLLSVLAGGRVVKWGRGLPGQGGDTHFLQRFALQTHDAYDPVAAMKFALEHQNPLVTGEVIGGGDFPETSFSLVTVSDPDVLLWALKPQDDVDEGIVARLWNLSSDPVDSSLSFSRCSLQGVERVTHIETPIEDVPVVGNGFVASLTAHQIGTFALSASLECISLPASEGYGNIGGGDKTHVNETNYCFDGTPGDVTIGYQVWDVDFGTEVEILVNGVHIDYAAVTPNATWSEARSVVLPDGLVLDTGVNTLTFNNTYNPSRTYAWGVRNVSVFETGDCTGCIPLPDSGAYGRIAGGDQTHVEEVNYSFLGRGGDVTVGYQVWDVDFGTEVEILVNGAHVDYADVTPNGTWSGTCAIVLPDGLVLDAGVNTLTFNNTYNPPQTYAWGVRSVSILDTGDCAGCIPLPDPAGYGNIAGGDKSHVEEVNYSFPGSPGDVTVGYEVWDVDFDYEVEIFLNGVHVDYTAVTPNATWSQARSIVLPDGLVLDAGVNSLTFNNTFNPPKTYAWGVRNVSILETGGCSGCIPLPDSGAYGRITGGDQAHVQEVSYSFPGIAGDVTVEFQVWDVDFDTEVEILVNGVHVDYAAVTPNETWSATRFLVIPDGLVSDSATNVLTFDNTYNPPNTYWWGVRSVSVY